MSPKVIRRKRNFREEKEKTYFNIFKFIIFGIWKKMSEFQSMLFTTLKLELRGTQRMHCLKYYSTESVMKKLKIKS